MLEIKVMIKPLNSCREMDMDRLGNMIALPPLEEEID